MIVSWNSTNIIPLTLSFLFVFIFIFRDVFAAPTRHLCHPKQRDTLLNFKNEFEIEEPSHFSNCHPKTESWAKNSDCCNWEGITCNAKSGKVIELNLSRSCLHGRFQSNSSLQNLHFLTTLDLSSNDFMGQIPYSIGKLSPLTSLDLSFNGLNGQIPSSIGNLSHLTSLDLSFNDFYGQIPSSIGNLYHLTTLDLSYNQFSGQILSSIGNLSHLTTLDLSYNQFSGQIASSIGNLSLLTTLDLSHNLFSGQIPSSIGNLSLLTKLILSSNQFSGQIPSSIGNLYLLTILSLNANQFLGQIPSSIGNLSHLTFLYLSNNQFSGQIPSSIGNLYHLTTLDLSNNQFSGQIPSSIGNLSHLTTLYLSSNQFSGEIQLNDFLSYFKMLSTLNLSGNHVSITNKSSDPLLQPIQELSLSGCGITELPELLRTQHELGFLDISNNKITGQVPGWLWTLPSLEYVNLSSNTFNGFERSTKPGIASIRKPSMSHLLGSNNNFTGKIPSFICALHSLKTLDLSNNNFSGSIPRCMGNLKSTLTVLNLRQNNLSGGLPEPIFERLRSLDVGHNQLVGELPRSLNRVSTLEVLNVENNKIQDTFPLWLSSLPELQVLVLRSNAFHGVIHQVSFPKLRIIDISHNHFNGTLPTDYFMKWSAMSSLGTDEDRSDDKYMGKQPGFDYYNDLVVLMNTGVELELVRILKIYTVLDFSGNKLEGDIPKSIGLLKELHVLDLSDNAFSGHIPSSMGNLRSLSILNLSNNNFSGSIPRCLGNLKSTLSVLNLRQNNLSGGLPKHIFERLRSLDVGHNQLVGELPRSLNRLFTLEVLNVENNKIQDTFPLWLSSLPELQVLVLRSNAFHGPIHQASFPKLRIIDISHNHFNETLPPEYFVKWSVMSSLGTNKDRSNTEYMGDQRGGSYYHDSVVLMNRGVELELVRILKIYTALDFSGNKLEGDIPKSIGLLKEIHVLNLSNNAFTGHIPSSMGNLTALESLDVSQNKLSGEIPQELGNLSFLAYMNFSHNKLSGLVPGGTQFRTQNCSSFEDNMGLFGPSLDEDCINIHTPASQHNETPESEEEDEEVLSWIAAAIGFITGIAFGSMIGYILVSHKPKQFMNPFGQNNRRQRSTTTH